MALDILHFQSNDLNLYYEDHGPKDQTAILFTHGLALSHKMWQPQVEHFSSEYRVITWDVRGHGQSEVGDGQYTLETYVDDLIQLIEHLKLKQVVLCGLSMGGYITQRALERYPNKFLATVLCDTRSGPAIDEAKQKRFFQLKRMKQQGMTAVADEFVAAGFAKRTYQQKPELIEEATQIMLQQSPIGIGGALLALASRLDLTPALKKIQIPTLLLVGEWDQLTPPAIMEKMQQAIGHASFNIISQAAHMSNWENPEQFNLALSRFLSGIES